jgi:hypothetical protein
MSDMAALPMGTQSMPHRSDEIQRFEQSAPGKRNENFREIAGDEMVSAVIPGPREARSPESITTAREYGFRARGFARVQE